jgi:hypothetical protein
MSHSQKIRNGLMGVAAAGALALGGSALAGAATNSGATTQQRALGPRPDPRTRAVTSAPTARPRWRCQQEKVRGAGRRHKCHPPRPSRFAVAPFGSVIRGPLLTVPADHTETYAGRWMGEGYPGD